MAPKRLLLNKKQMLAFLKGQKTMSRYPCRFAWGNRHPIQDAQVCRLTEQGTAALLWKDGHAAYSKPPCQPGKTFYVPEPWYIQTGHRYECDVKILYGTPELDGQLFTLDFQGNRAAYDRFMEQWDTGRWNSAMTMPMEVVRLRLQVKRVYCERLQDMDALAAYQEGMQAEMPGACRTPEYPQDFPAEFNSWSVARKEDWIRSRATAAYIANQEWANALLNEFEAAWDAHYGNPMPVKKNGEIQQYVAFPWANIQGSKMYKGQPLMVCGNPWVWVVEYERV